MTARTGGELPRIPGVRYADHVAFTVPDLDRAVQFFVEALGAQELYRSTRGPDAHFMPENFAVPADARLTLAMLRMPPNLNVELFEWSSSDRRTEHPRHSDAGGHHLCFTVADVDQAVAVLRGIPGVRLLGDRKEVAGDSPRVTGNRWIYFLTPWGLLMEIVDRSRVADPPPLVGPADWHTATHHTAAHDDPRKDQWTMRIAGSTLGTPEQTVPEALELFAAAGLDAAEVIYQDGYRSGLPLRDRRSAERARRASQDLGVPIVGLTPYTTGINALDDADWQSAVDEFRGAIEIAQVVGADRLRVYAGSWQPDQRDLPAHWDRLVAALRTLALEASDAGIRLCVENHFGTMTQSAAQTARLVREVDHPAVRVLYDQANLTFTHDEPYEEALRIQGDLVGHVHVKDLVFTDPDAPFQASETARVAASERAVRSRVVGDGIVPWADILWSLSTLGYDDVLTLEYEYRWHPQDLPEPAVGFARSAAALRAFLAQPATAESAP